MNTISSICIAGGGSLGLVCASVFASNGIKVNILTGHPDSWSVNICAIDPAGRHFSGDLNTISSNPAETVRDVDMILLCLPGYLIEETLLKIKPHLNQRTIVGSIVSSTGFFFFAHDHLPSTTPLFGFQRVPFIARIQEYGKIGDLLGYKDSVNIATENITDIERFRSSLEEILLTPVNVLNSFYEAALTNSNPLLHTARLYQMFRHYDGKPYSDQILFYADWNDEASDILLKMDDEFMMLLDALKIRKGAIPSLLEYYESTDASSLTKKISSIEAFRSIRTPMLKNGDGWIPDFHSRYFTEDFPFGLHFIKTLTDKMGINAPTINEVYQWGVSVCRRD